MEPTKTPRIPRPPTETKLAERAAINALGLFLPFLQGGDLPTPDQMKEAAGFLSDIDFKAVEQEIRLGVIDCPAERRDALKIAIFGRFEGFISLDAWGLIVADMKARHGVLVSDENNVVMMFIRTALSTRGRLLKTFEKLGVCPFCGLAEALRDYITGATDWGLYVLIQSKGEQRPDPAPRWVGSQSEAVRFAKAARLTEKQFNLAFGRIKEDGSFNPDSPKAPIRFSNMKKPKEATTDNRHPKLLSIIERFGLVPPE